MHRLPDLPVAFVAIVVVSLFPSLGDGGEGAAGRESFRRALRFLMRLMVRSMVMRSPIFWFRWKRLFLILYFVFNLGRTN
jgi:hypothetical protein